MTTSTDGPVPSVRPGPEDGPGRDDDAGQGDEPGAEPRPNPAPDEAAVPDDGPSPLAGTGAGAGPGSAGGTGGGWLQDEIRRRIAEGQATNARHARRGNAPVDPAQHPTVGYVPKHSTSTPGPGAPPPGPVGGQPLAQPGELLRRERTAESAEALWPSPPADQDEPEEDGGEQTRSRPGLKAALAMRGAKLGRAGGPAPPAPASTAKPPAAPPAPPAPSVVRSAAPAPAVMPQQRPAPRPLPPPEKQDVPTTPVPAAPAAPTAPIAPVPAGPEPDAQDPSGKRVRVVLSERTSVAKPVRVVVDIQEGTGVGELLRRNLISNQLAGALRFAALALLTIGLLPVVFAIYPELGQVEVFGMIRLPWLILGVLVYPFLFGIGIWHTRYAEKVEQNFADHVQD